MKQQNNIFSAVLSSIGSFVFTIILPIWTAICSALIIITSFVSNDIPHKILNMWGIGGLIILKYLTCLKVDIQNIPKNLSGEIIVSEHQSAFEILALVGCIPKSTFVLKKSMMNIPIVGYALKRLRMIPVSRSKFNANWMDIAKKNLEDGYNIIIFPEGTRIEFGAEVQYRSGAFKLAEHTKKKIIPVAIDTGKFWSRRSFLKKPGTAKIIFGKPIEGNPEILRKTVKTLLPR